MTNKSHEIGVYVDDIPMRLSERYRPLDVSAYTDEETHIPDVFDADYRFSAELYALEVFEFRDKQKQKLLSQSMSKLDLKSNNNINSLKSQTDDRNEAKKTIHLNPGEILKPLSTVDAMTRLSDISYRSDRSIDPNVNIKRKLVKDFESDTSSPFDYVELQTIDDMQALNDVFQAFQSKSIQTKHSTNETNCKSDENVVNNSNANNCNENNCQQNVSSFHNMNGSHLLGAYGHQQQTQQPLATVSAPHSGQPFNNSHWTTASIYNNTSDLSAGSSCVNTGYNSSATNHLPDSQHNLLRSSKSASDLPTLVNSEETVRTTRRQRSHTPPCAASKTKSKQYMSEKQTLVLNDPYEELSQHSKDFVNSISSMGFERSRVARAVKHMDNDHKKVIDFLLQVQTLEETDYDCCEAEIALHMNNYQISDAKKFLESLRQLSEVGFDKRDIIKALVKCNNDRDRALDILLSAE